MRWVGAAGLAGGMLLLVAGCGATDPYANAAPASPAPSHPAAFPAPSQSAAFLSPSRSAAPDWVGTWGVAMTDGGQAFERQTVRQIVHTSVAGDRARLELSHAFGRTPLVIGGVHVARQVSGSTIDPATDTVVTFGGRTAVTIPAGGTVTSDPVSFAVPADADLAVSVHLPAATGETTRHPLGTRDNFIGTGDQLTATSIRGAETSSNYFFLTGLDVHNSAAEGTVVAFGASITDGLDSAFGANQRWPDLLADRLRAAGRTIGVVNTGISGNRLTADGTDGRGESAAHRFERDVLRRTGVRWVIISDDPLNDLGSHRAPGSDEIISAYRQLIDRGHAAGIRVICSTLTPFRGADYWSSRGEQGRAEVNAFVRGAGSGCDAVLDQDAATHDPASPTRFLAANDSGDHLHPGDKGMRVIAGAVDLDWFD
ncbi:lysophospholipase L1-like esterase [Actinoplanes octamycinicus]|uniref:Lysophospholipase L1-like esterase n=1 Tax=Actinoplanes octamycinicus TaxID=135948 RepID=A0A7W7H6R5_9ACTN|nr:GDSL-type esterase/lipase family protein [Actinoplanes octamycinicus]MBB4745046.1 lysophospholipase L1-like esterase [Actinoplanes octamycinicus]